MQDCPFCKEDIFKSSFLSSENFLAIYNRSPILPGHSMIIPKMHFPSLLDLPKELLEEMMLFSIHTVKLLIKVFNAEGFDWTIQDGTAAGQTVHHLHLHLIPRKTGDLPDPGDWYPKLEMTSSSSIDNGFRPQLSTDEISKVIDHIKLYI